MMRFPSDSPKSLAVWSVASDVVSVRTYSMSGMNGTGFMKCMPRTWSARCVEVAGFSVAASMTQVALGEVSEGGRPPHTLIGSVSIGSRQLATVDGGAHRAFDALAAFREKLIGELANDRGIARFRADLGDT
jgi:hypothetical protein